MTTATSVTEALEAHLCHPDAPYSMSLSVRDFLDRKAINFVGETYTETTLLAHVTRNRAIECSCANGLHWSETRFAAKLREIDWLNTLCGILGHPIPQGDHCS